MRNDWFYGIIGGTELDHWLGKSTYADNNTRHFDEARFSARKQSEGECPLVYVEKMSNLAATCIEWGNPENMLVTTMVEVLTPYWYYQLYNKQMAHVEKVYTSCYGFIYDAESRHTVWQSQNAGKEREATTYVVSVGGQQPWSPDGIKHGMDMETFVIESKNKMVGGTNDTMGWGDLFACTHCRRLNHSKEFYHQNGYRRGGRPVCHLNY
jgi:hypothetical protein